MSSGTLGLVMAIAAWLLALVVDVVWAGVRSVWRFLASPGPVRSGPGLAPQQRVAQLRKHTRQIADDGGGSQGPQGRPPQGVDGGRSVCDVHFARRNYHGLGVLAVALQPDFASFFQGLEAALLVGGVLVIALVVVMAIRRFLAL